MNVDFKTFGLDHANPDPDSIKGRLKAALNLSESDIFEVPVLYFNQDRPTVWFGLALSPGMVNLNSMSEFEVWSDPFLEGMSSLAQHFSVAWARCRFGLTTGRSTTPRWAKFIAGRTLCGSRSRRSGGRTDAPASEAMR